MAIIPKISSNFHAVTWEDLDNKAKEDYDFWTKFKEDQEKSLKDYQKTFEEFKIDGETLDNQPPKVKHAHDYIEITRRKILDAKIEISNLFAEYNFEVGGINTDLTEAEIESLTPEQLEKYKASQSRKTTAGMVKDIKEGAVYSFSPDDPPGGTNVSSTGALQGDEGVKGDIQVDIENKSALGADAINQVDQKVGGNGKFGRYAIYLIDPITELIEDGAIALAVKMGMPGLANAITYYMYYEAANLAATAIDAIPEGFKQAQYAQMDQSMILGAGIGLVDEEQFANWKNELDNVTQENVEAFGKDIEQMGKRSPLSHAWAAYEKIAEETWLPSIPSGPEIFSNALSGIKKITGGR